MHMILLLVGVAAAVGGGMMFAAGILHQDAPLSATWVTAGTVAVIGGFVIIGLGAVLSRLRRIIDRLDRQPAAPFADETIAPMAAPASAGARKTAPVPPPSAPEVKPTDAMASPESKGAPAVSVEPALKTGEGEPSLIDKTRDLFEKPVDELPAPSSAPDVKAAVPEPKVDLPPGRDWPRMTPGDRFAEPRSDAAPPIVPPITPPGERPAPRVDMPETPTPRAEPSVSRPEPLRPEPSRPDPLRAESSRQDPLRAEPLRSEPPRFEPPRQEPVVPPAARGAPTVLKSGVIEGMAYTLYSDGSIEAELAQGSMRFDSIPALRAYLRDIG